MIYDFLWDDQGDLGVWVEHEGEEVCVEAAKRRSLEGAPYDYVLASDIELKPSDGILAGGMYDTVYGAAAQKALAHLQRIEGSGEQIAVNDAQARLLGKEIAG